MALSVGSPAPDFRLSSTSGGESSLSDFRGKKLVVYFYPRDETPGCTQESCDFRDNYRPLRDAGAEVIGISGDTIDSHHRFQAHHSLPFPLLSDPGHEVARAWGAYGEKNMYGKIVMGTIRSTYVVDENGVIAAVWSPVRVGGHVEQVVTTLGGQPVPATPPAASMPSAPPAAARKVPARKVVRRSAARKAVRKASARKAPARKASRKAPARKAARKAPARKAARKAPVRKAPARKASRKAASKRRR